MKMDSDSARLFLRSLQKCSTMMTCRRRLTWYFKRSLEIYTHVLYNGYQRRPVQLAVDIYAIGVLLWFLWNRTPPWKGKSVHSIMSSVRRGKRPQLSKSEQGVAKFPAPPALDDLIGQCWAQAAGDRPQASAAFETFDRDVAPAVSGDTQSLTSDLQLTTQQTSVLDWASYCAGIVLNNYSMLF